MLTQDVKKEIEDLKAQRQKSVAALSRVNREDIHLINRLSSEIVTIDLRLESLILAEQTETAKQAENEVKKAAATADLYTATQDLTAQNDLLATLRNKTVEIASSVNEHFAQFLDANDLKSEIVTTVASISNQLGLRADFTQYSTSQWNQVLDDLTFAMGCIAELILIIRSLQTQLVLIEDEPGFLDQITSGMKPDFAEQVKPVLKSYSRSYRINKVLNTHRQRWQETAIRLYEGVGNLKGVESIYRQDPIIPDNGEDIAQKILIDLASRAASEDGEIFMQDKRHGGPDIPFGWLGSLNGRRKVSVGKVKTPSMEQQVAMHGVLQRATEMIRARYEGQ
jgi:hypothetical protein